MRWGTGVDNLDRRDPRERIVLVLALVLAGVASGLAGVSLVWLLRLTQHLAYGLAATFPAAVEAAPPWRRVLAPAAGGLLAGMAWLFLRRRTSPSLEDAVGPKATPLPLRRSLADAVTQIVLVGSGASIGREGAPRLAGAAFASVIATRGRLPQRWRVVAMAAAAGAGLGTVYNAPVAGALFALEVLGVGFTWSQVAAVITVSTAAAITAWPLLGTAATFSYPAADGAWTTWLWVPFAAVAGVGLGRGFSALVRAAGRLRPGNDWRLPLGIATVGAIVGAISIWLPAIPGNGKGIIFETLSAQGTLLTFAALVVLKPLATAATYGSGADGGLIAPSLSTGAAAGATVALAGQLLGADLSVAAFALVGGGAMLAVTQKAPFFAAVFVLELVHPPLGVAAALAVAALSAGWLAGPSGPFASPAPVVAGAGQ